MLDHNVRLRNRLLEFYNNGFDSITSYARQEFSEELVIIIKRYPNGTVSREVHEHVSSIEGIYGEGLPVKRGVNIIITGGTGILPFLDLFDLLLKKCIAVFATAKGVHI